MVSLLYVVRPLAVVVLLVVAVNCVPPARQLDSCLRLSFILRPSIFVNEFEAVTELLERGRFYDQRFLPTHPRAECAILSTQARFCHLAVVLIRAPDYYPRGCDAPEPEERIRLNWRRTAYMLRNESEPEVSVDRLLSWLVSARPLQLVVPGDDQEQMLAITKNLVADVNQLIYEWFRREHRLQFKIAQEIDPFDESVRERTLQLAQEMKTRLGNGTLLMTKSLTDRRRLVEHLAHVYKTSHEAAEKTFERSSSRLISFDTQRLEAIVELCATVDDTS